MYNQTILLETLQWIEDCLLHVIQRTENIGTPGDFVNTPHGVDMLDVASIRLMAVGEEINKINQKTKGELLKNYPEIDWKAIVAFRNFVAHTYHEINATNVFNAVKKDVNPLLETVRKMKLDIRV